MCSSTNSACSSSGHPSIALISSSMSSISRGLKPGSAFSRSNSPGGWQPRRSWRHGIIPPGTTTPSTGGGGNISGKFSEATRRCCSLASVQIVALLTSWEVAKEKYTLPGSSFWKKSKMPCWPGCLPVTSEVHAGGVRGGMIERSTARVPRPHSSARFGITPLSMYGSRIVNVAPSRPISSVGPMSNLQVGGLAVLAHEHREVRDGQVTLVDGALPDFVEELGERQSSVALLDHRREHHDLERLETEVGDESRIRADLARVLPVALRLGQKLEDSLRYLRIERGHVVASEISSSPDGPGYAAVATIRFSSRCVHATSRRPATSTNTASFLVSIAHTQGASEPPP